MTNSQILIIHNFPILFTILNENKSILNFEIENVNNDKINEYSEKKNLLIISGEKNFITEKQIKISQ